MTNKKLIKSTGIIGCATIASRLLGFVRDVVFARLFGTNIFAQAFVVAFRLPNMLRDMVGEGATDAAIVPILSEYRHTRTAEEYWEASRVILNLMVLVLAILTVAGIIFAPFLVRIIAPGFLDDTVKFSTAVSLTRALFPYIFFLGLVAYSKGVLSSFDYFIMPAAAPVILNITMIAALYFLCGKMGINGLVLGVLAGGFLQMVVQIPPLLYRGFRIRKTFQLAHPVAKRIGKLLLPRALGTAVYQLSVFIDTILASLAWIVGSGGVAALYYSNRLVQLPLAVFGVALATAALPRMSKEVAENNIDKLKDTISFSLRFVFMVTVPSSVGLMILASSIVKIIFQGGEFSSYSTAITSNALFYYTFGLSAYAGIKILVSTFYSMGDTRTPVLTAAVSLLINFVLNIILMWPLKLGGLALATSIAAISNFAILYTVLNKRIGDIGTRKIALGFVKVSVSSAIMACGIFAAKRMLLDTVNVEERLIQAFGLLAVILVSVFTYLIAAYVVKVEGLRELCSLIKSKIR